MKNFIEFIFTLLRTILLLAVVGVLVGALIFVLLIFIPTQVVNAFNIINDFLKALGAIQ